MHATLLLVNLCVICLPSSPSPAASSFLPSSSSSASISYPVTKGPSEGIQEEVREPWLLFGLNFRTESHIVLEFLNLEGQMIWHLTWSLAILLFIFDNAEEQREEKRGWVGGGDKQTYN